ncbi:hypothetical protein TNCV_1994601 [Trichonephila clavipes]|nr:hypothetical protein TNCV_1994601 [Trichonephila clavipes]
MWVAEWNEVVFTEVTSVSCNTTTVGFEESGDTVERGCLGAAALCTTTLVLPACYGMGWYWISLSHSSSTHCTGTLNSQRYISEVLEPGCPSLPSRGLSHSHISTG